MFLKNYQPYTVKELLFLFLTGVFAAAGQYGLTFSYKYAKASEISIYSYTTVLFSALLGFLIFGEILTTKTFIGLIIIFVASYLNYNIIKRG